MPTIVSSFNNMMVRGSAVYTAAMHAKNANVLAGPCRGPWCYCPTDRGGYSEDHFERIPNGLQMVRWRSGTR